MGLKKQIEEQREELQQEIRKTRLPRGAQALGIVEQRLGGTRMRVRCLDGKPRICRVPGRLKRRLWIREGDTVLVEPWELSGNEKGDIVFKYSKAQVQWLKQNGHLKEAEEFESF
ncbi:translation initiation factor eIF-1A [Candidatus Woesearchaeota archaeon]|nr:translation initiation factor eIF-1A [Candidatus Woesearchaeota archaeon]